MECFSAILLFDAFSARKMKRFRHWIIVTSLAFLEATFLNIASKALPDYSKILIALVLYYFVHRILYISNRFFGLYISIIIYATMCCIDNLWHTLALLLSETLNGVFLGNALCQSMLVHGIIIVVCFLQAKARNGKLSQATNFRWYTIPAVLSLASVLLIFFFGSCFQQGQISIQPLCVCATFITVMQIAALLLISWMEQNANFREEAISLQAKSKAQQESIEALSAAYAQQRKLTHDFRAHLSTLDGMLMQQNRDINTIQTYIHSLQSKQTERILLVNTHHAALDALLNQKALVAKNRKIDIQFSVNDLSPIKIDMVDLTVVISNTLDNAIEACEKLPETDRQIYVQALLEEDELFYAVRNKSLPVNMIANQLPASTKENPSFHGYGLQNVHTTLEKYHTLYAMDYLKTYRDQWLAQKQRMGSAWQTCMDGKWESYRESLQKLRGKNFIVINDFGWPISPDHYGKIVDRVAEKAGIRKIHPHMFRHTFVSILLSNPDIGVATVAAEAGHAQPSTTLAIYTQVYHKRQDSIRSQMSETLYKRKTPER